MSSRRQFLRTLSSALLLPIIAAKREAKHLPIAFSTLGCPAWNWKKVLDFASKHGFAAVELRGLEGNLDLPSHPVFSDERIGNTKQEISASGLRIACVSSSAQLHVEDSEKRAKELADARRFIDLATKLGAPYVRVFGGKAESDTNPAPSEGTKRLVAAGLHELGEYAGSRGIGVIIESHDHFTASSTLKEVLRAADSKYVGLLWDAHHTFATSNEEPEFTVRELGPWIRHTHLKDSVGNGEDRKYVLTGRGTVPIRRQIAALQSIGYRGFYCFEWEKVWHPDLEDPEVAVADYARVVRGYIGKTP